MRLITVASLSILVLSCGGGAKPVVKGPSGGTGGTDDSMPLGQPCVERMLTMPADDSSAYGPLETGSDWATYEKVSTTPWVSKTHGGRFVETYVNAVGAAAYKSDAPVPEGTVIVKISWENEGGKASTKAGPIFVMKKEAAGYSPDHEDWSYGIHWAEPTEAQKKFLGGPIYWRGKSGKVEYCVKCHDNYDRELGGIPKEHRAW